MNVDKKIQFVDTNILVYAYSSEENEKKQSAKALLKDLWDSAKGALSIQVLQEFYVVVTQKASKPLSPNVAVRIVDDLGNWICYSPVPNDVTDAIRIQQQYHISFWDAMIIGSAKAVGAEIIWSEDLNHGQSYEGVCVLNPFIN